MYLNSIMVMLGDAAATPAPGAQTNPTAEMLTRFFPFLILGVMVYFALIRPQSKRAKEHANMLKTIKQNDQVTTSGGIVGIVVSMKDDTVVIRSADTKLEVLKSAVSAVVRPKSSTES